MTNTDAVKKVEDTVKKSGQFVYKIDGITPCSFLDEEATIIPPGKYMIVETRIAVPVSESV